ncbi:MAG: hypothetical protein E7562_03810 [Ruminococcaceae bacterium]|nr:hypothetical protein [Oscillospiraceae bacterium]
MKKFLSVILAITMVFSLFAGLNVFAEETDLSNTVMTAERKRSAYAESSNILGTAVHSSIANSSGTDMPKAGFVYDVPAEPDTHNLSMRLSSPKVTGIGVTGVREYFTFTPYAKILGGVDAFMVYMELPEYNKYGEQWSMRSLSFQMYDEGVTAQWKTPCNMTIKYLENDATAWVTTTVGANGEYYLPSGFKGYIKMYFNTATNGNSSENLYDFLNSKGITTDDEFIIGCMQFEVNYIGGAYGDVVIGGMYNVISDGDALTANLSDDGGTAHKKVAKLTGTNRHVGEGVTEFWNQRGNYEVNVGDDITYGVLAFDNFGTAVRTWASPAIGAKHPEMKISSETATGNAYGVTGRFSSEMWTPIDPEIGAFGMYLELPKYADGDQWIIMNKSFAFSDGTVTKYMSPNNMKISYLAIDGKEWVDSVTSSSGHFYLPSGFKGYVKCYLKTATDGNTTTSFFDALKANGINYETKLQINAYQFDVKRVGGEYGDLIIGGPYGLKADGNSLEANITDWKYKNNVSKITTYEPTLTATRKNYAYFDGNTYYEGAAVNKSVAQIWDLKWYTDSGASQAALSWTAPVEPDTNNAAVRAHSDIAEGQGIPVGPANMIIHPNTEIDPEINALMLYVELPFQGTPMVDGNYQYAAYTIKTNAGTFYQHRSSAKFGRMYNMAVSYLERDGKEWKTVENSADNEYVLLPNGFKGYIKLHLDTAVTDTATGKTLYEHLESQSLDTTKPFRVTDINIVFGWLGGKFGDFVVGGMYEITEDGNGIYANLSDSDGSNAKYACLTTFKSDNEARIDAIEDVVNNKANPTIADGEAIHNAIDAYNNIADEYADNITAETLNALYDIEEAHNVYRPQFVGSTVKNAPFDDDQALRIDMTIDTTAASAAGYTVSEYGIVVLKDQLWSNSARFDETAENGTVYKQTDIADDAVINYSFLIETNDADVIQLDHYVRSYVVYTNGAESVTVWNARYARDAYTTVGGGTVEGTVAATNEFYYRTSIIETSSYLDIAVMAGAQYGDVDMNGFVETDDLVSLRKHLIGINKNVYEFISDVNDDEKVNVKDLVRFKKYFADTENVKIGADTYTTYSYIETPVSEVVESAAMSLYNAAAATEADTDITVTSFNVGHFYLGTQDGINPGAYGADNAQAALNGWEALFAKAAEKSDIYAFQEFGQKYYWDDTTTILPDEVMLGEGKPFKQLERFFGYTQGQMEMGMAFGATSGSEYDVHNISYGYVGGKDTYYRRAYIKGYITIKGVEVAIISIHPGGYGSAKGNSWDNGSFMWKDCFDELVALMNEEEYCIVLGDTNTNTCGAYMQSRGMNIANCGKFGDLNTNMYHTDTYIDNVFTTPNIDIVTVEVVAEDRGGSDHYPITAGLFVNTKMGSTKGMFNISVDSLGFATGRY